MFLNLKTLNVKMHRDGSFCTNGLCVLFYSSNKEFQSFTGQPNLLKCLSS